MAKWLGSGQGHGVVSKTVGTWPRPWGRDQDCGGVTKAVGACHGCGGVVEAVGGGRDRGGVAKAVGTRPRLWGRGQGRGGGAKAVVAVPNPCGVA